MKFVLAMMFFVSSTLFASDIWEVSQVKINHVQIVENGKFYMTIDGDLPEASNCTQLWGKHNWVGFLIEDGNQSQKEIIAMALSAYTNETLVDVGAFSGGCIDATTPAAKLDYIRVGNYR